MSRWRVMPSGIEIGTDADGSYYVLRNPIFFTTSVLDVDPADTDARALGTEDTTAIALRKRATALRRSEIGG
jgi:hypothetical protein